MAVMPVRVVNMRLEPCDIRIDRATRWGNPFKITQQVDRARVLTLYAEYVTPDHVRDLLEEIERFTEANPVAVEVRLGCWCKPLGCHGDILAVNLNRIRGA